MLLKPVQRIILPTRKKPSVVDVSMYSSAGTPIIAPMPARREAGLLGILVSVDNSGAGVPSTPSGWTQLSANSRRVAYKYLDGSEGPTLSITATGSTNNTTIILTIDSVSVSKTIDLVPVVTGTSTVPLTTDLTLSGVVNHALMLYIITFGNADLVRFAAGFNDNRYTIRNANGGCAVATKPLAIGADTPTPWTISASVFWTATALGFKAQ